MSISELFYQIHEESILGPQSFIHLFTVTVYRSLWNLLDLLGINSAQINFIYCSTLPKYSQPVPSTMTVILGYQKKEYYPYCTTNIS